MRQALESEVKFVRAWAFTGLHQLAREFEGLRPEAKERFKEALAQGSAAVRARVRKIQAQGFD